MKKTYNLDIDFSHVLFFKKFDDLGYIFYKRGLVSKFEAIVLMYYKSYFYHYSNTTTMDLETLCSVQNEIEQSLAEIDIPFGRDMYEYWKYESFTFFGNTKTKCHGDNQLISPSGQTKDRCMKHQSVVYNYPSEDVVDSRLNNSAAVQIEEILTNRSYRQNKVVAYNYHVSEFAFSQKVGTWNFRLSKLNLNRHDLCK